MSLEWIRNSTSELSCPYFFTDEQVDQVCRAIEWSAENAWKLLPNYVFDCDTGEWKHRQNLTYQDRRWLGDIRFTKSGVVIKENNQEAKHGTKCVSLAQAITEADKISSTLKVRGDGADQTSGFLGKLSSFFIQKINFGLGEAHELRWFLLPSEAIDLYKKRVTFEQIKKSPFSIRTKIPSNLGGAVNVDDEVVKLLKSIVNWDGPNKMVIKPKDIEMEKTSQKKKKPASR